jgi:hypothetical protein
VGEAEEDGAGGTFRLLRGAVADGYLGSYEIEPGRIVSISRFGDPNVLMYVDTGTGRLRALFAVAPDAFVTGGAVDALLAELEGALDDFRLAPPSLEDVYIHHAGRGLAA